MRKHADHPFPARLFRAPTLAFVPSQTGLSGLYWIFAQRNTPPVNESVTWNDRAFVPSAK